ncbi:F-box/kelch-repeat protein At1g57790-like [Durio zibethinus]|uniref:F-box/kelch-repeat protein At1g57790-like n=1 Tax=Durio zibethinus TaxID=66656 RepID=A0A6P5XX42_DURZI|nr:F-box/kelch-repeat protein At1g57790-like [Durio zibethinus]
MENKDLIPSEKHQVDEDQDVWSNLPPELLSLVSSNLFAGDKAIFYAICKTWRSIPITPPRPLPSPFDHAFPWLFRILKSNIDRGQFFHPIHNYTCELDLSAEVLGAEIRFSKYGWLLMTRDEVHPFLFNPLTKEIIELPELPPLEWVHSMFFTSPPSPDCLVLGIEGRFYLVSIFVHKLGEDSWEMHNFPCHVKFRLSVCNPILYRELYYCLDAKGNLGVFDLKNIENSWDTYKITFPSRRIKSIVQAYLVENEEELLAILITKDDQKIHVLKLNLTSKTWEPVRSLGRNMLFVSKGASFSKTAAVRGTSNKIYGPNFWDKNGSFCFYSLATGKYHSFFDNPSSKDSYNIKFLQQSSWFISM